MLKCSYECEGLREKSDSTLAFDKYMNIWLCMPMAVIVNKTKPSFMTSYFFFPLINNENWDKDETCNHSSYIKLKMLYSSEYISNIKTKNDNKLNLGLHVYLTHLVVSDSGTL